jgi:hypothetical protein
VSVRFRGLVKAAREFEAYMLAGLPRVEAPSFLDAARKIVARVQRTCLEKGATIADLPRPSRSAVARLSALARLGPDDLGPIRRRPPTRRLRIANITSNLARFLEVLGLDPGADVLSETLEAMRGSVERIDHLCREAGTSPGRLPERSAYAFAMMKWLAGWDVERLLAGPDRLGQYVAQARLARGPLEEATARLWRDGPREINIAFVPGHHVWRVRPKDGVAFWRLATGWLKGRKRDFEDLAATVAERRGRRRSRPRLERHRAFTESPGFREIDRELERLLAGDQYRPRGRFRDLGAIFARVNRELFGSALARPRLHWTERGSKARFGSYDRVRDVVCMNPVLDDPRVPEHVTAYVLYHELLHKSHGFRLAGTRRMAHTREFAADERRFPGWETASKWLELLAAGWDAPPPEAEPAQARTVADARETPAGPPGTRRSSA